MLRAAAPGPALRWAGPVAGVSAAAVLGWGLSVPALWLDESATVVATQRDWGALWRLHEGSEAPLVPFYAVVKVVVGAVGAVLPEGALPLEVPYRLPSVVAAVLAVGVLAAWLARHATRGVVVASVGVLLLMPSFSLYGQAARPYAVALAVAVLATVAWSRLVGYGAGLGGRPSAIVPSDGGPDRRALALAGASYAAAVAALTLAHLLAVSLVAAHLVLAAVAPGELGRRRALLRTVAAAGAGLLPMLPFVAVVVANGKGPQTTPNFTPSGVGDVFLRLFVQPQAHIAGAAVLLAAAAVGMTRVRSRRHGAVARIAVAWALVPPAVLLPLFWARPSLIAHRYLVFVVPAWAMLGGLGLVTVAEVTQRAVRGAPGRGGSRRAGSAWRGTVVVAILAVTAVLQATTLDGVRSPSSHGEDIRPALRAAGTGGREDLPLVVLSRGALEVATYSRDDEARLLGVHVQRRSGSIWPVTDPEALRPDRLRDQPRLVLLLRGRRHGPCRWRAGAEPTRFVTRCMPAAVRAYGYRVESATLEGHRWAVAVLVRPPVIPDATRSAEVRRQWWAVSPAGTGSG